MEQFNELTYEMTAESLTNF